MAQRSAGVSCAACGMACMAGLSHQRSVSCNQRHGSSLAALAAGAYRCGSAVNEAHRGVMAGGSGGGKSLGM